MSWRQSRWPLLYSFPPVPDSMIDEGYKQFAERWNPILDVFGDCGVRFALEVHPTEIAFDIYTAERALEAIGRRPEFGFNFDPSHLIWQGVDPVEFIRYFPDRIYHVHMKDASTTLDGRTGINSSHLPFGDPRRGWDFRSVGRGAVRFEEIIRALNSVGYNGLQEAGKALGVEVAYTENVTDADAERVLRDYASRGYNLVFAHSFSS
jgi:sugar phosphate isomerase/epimerase